MFDILGVLQPASPVLFYFSLSFTILACQIKQYEPCEILGKSKGSLWDISGVGVSEASLMMENK